MVQTCSKCARANPAEAVYCYFDGFVLGGHSRNGGPVAVGAQAFNHPFVFPGGRQCRSFDELALACQEEWAAACDLLQKGYLAGFFNGLGRVDLSQAAREAAKFPDPDRGLDQLLAKLPTEVLAEPHLRVETLEINLGVLSPGDQRDFHLHLENQGMRLVHGTVSCVEGNWLALGDADVNEKHFQFQHELSLPIHVRPDKLRAGNKPLTVRLEIESNGGSFLVVVRAQVPVKPFPSGVLAGAKSPRQVAEKAKANTKEAAGLFENGTVADWYKSNGWTYPVQGPAASGLGAIQQFFEALGLTAPPKVEINAGRIDLSGDVGDQLRYAVEVKSGEKRPVYAHGTSNQSWLEVSPAKLNGRRAVIDLSVPSVPDRPGETLTAKLIVQSNGNQRFVVPVTLQIRHNLVFDVPVPPSPAGVTAMPAPAALIVPPVLASSKGSGERRRRAAPAAVPPWLHLVPAVLLFLAVLTVVLVDLGTRKSAGGGAEEGRLGEESALVNLYQYPEDSLKDGKPLLDLRFHSDMKFGLEMSRERDPRDPDKPKKLTFEADGKSNNTIIKIDDSDYFFGEITPANRWVRDKMQKPVPNGMLSTMEFRHERVVVTQHVQIVPGQSGYLDTCLVHYTIQNQDAGKHKVGIRVMLDTYIGANDGVPFTIPGKKGFVDTQADLKRKQIPDYIEVVEKPDDLKDPGTVARMGLRHLRLGRSELEDLERLLICHWPGNRARWDLDAIAPINSEGSKDSCVVLYWPYETMNPRESRDVGFTYGLGALDIGSNLALRVPDTVPPDTDFVVTAYVWGARKGDKVKLQVPAGLKLADGESDEKTVEDGGARSQVFWHLRSGKSGTYMLEAASDKARAKPKAVIVKTTSIFG
jgi:hypothetical protein